jgi:hypothetical protein
MQTKPMEDRIVSRRHWIESLGQGFGGLVLGTMLDRDKAGASSAMGDQAAGNSLGSGGSLSALHHRPKAKRVVQLFMAGAASHLDLFDFKEELVKRHGQESDFGEPVEAFQNGLGPWLKPVWDFKRYGESGRLLSEPVSELGKVADELAFVHNVVGKTGVHSQATLLHATGFQLPGFPGMGAWVSYGLGSLNDNLPTFVVFPDHRGLASNGTKNWDSAFLAAQHSGTVIYPGSENPIADLRPHKSGTYITGGSQADGQVLLAELNARHAQERSGDQRLENPGAFEKEINAREETVHFSRKCLAARRMLERGVRFIQIWSGNDNGFPRRNWDSHEDIQRDHGPLSTGMAKGAAALIQDLKQRGMLEDTLILWTTEFGRMPSSQGGRGRDHNPYCFTNWLCGGGIRGGVSYGPSDAFGYKPLDRENPTQVYDIHATILHLLGIDHTKLTVRHNGIDRRLTDVHGHVLTELLA